MKSGFATEKSQLQWHLYGKWNGEEIQSCSLKNQNGVEARVINYGATLVALKVPDRNGRFDDVVLGYDDLDGYIQGMAYMGATIGRYGNRIANGRFSLNGRDYVLAQNDNGNSLHGGMKGFDRVVWRTQDVSLSDTPAVEFSYPSSDGEEGFPGNLNSKVTYSLTPRNELRIDYEVATDKTTVQNLTHHSYFNLSGGGEILGHELQLNADRFTPVNEILIPTGELRSVEGTPFDFREITPIGLRLGNADEQLTRGRGYDHNWVVNGESGRLRPAARVFDPMSGRSMEALTTEPGIQFYSGNFLNGDKGKNGRPNAYRTGFCLETQHFPDSPNRPDFPTTVLEPGERYRSTTIYRFL